MSKQHILVTGATGVVGPELIRQLLADGYHVRAMVRPGSDRSKLPPGCTPVTADLSDAAALREAVAGVQIVFHLAALLHINDPRPEMQAQYEAVNVEGTRLLVEAAAAAGVERFVYFSTINVYGASSPGQVWTEASETNPPTLYADTKHRAEDIVRQMPGGIILRMGAVYGPGMKGNYPMLAGLLRRGVRFMIGTGRNRRSLIHVADAAAAARFVAMHPSAAGQTFNATDGEIHTFDAIARAMQEALGRKPGLFYLPAAPVRLLLSAGQRMARLVGSSAPGPVLVDKLTEDVAVSGEKLWQLGFRPAFDLRAGWQDTFTGPSTT